MSLPHLAGQGLSYTYPRSQRGAVQGVDLELAPGFTALLGPNGSGKSTLLALLGGLLRPEQGEVSLDQSSAASLKRSRLAQRIAFLPAKPSVPADYCALEVVLMGRHPFGRGLLLERPEDLRRGVEALELAGASELSDRICEELSGGERQRVLLARAFCQDVPILLLDEPTSAQDLGHRLDLFELFARLGREGRIVVAATHAINAAARHADRLVVLARGALVADGSPAEVLDEDLLKSVFGVEALLGQDGQSTPYAVPRGRASS